MTHRNFTEGSDSRLLVVDDEVELRSLLAMKLSKSGFVVDVAADGQQAIDLLNAHHYTAVLCDLNLPERIKGGDLFSFVQHHTGDCTFIAITGYAPDSPEVRAARAAGIKHVFSKPLQMKAIVSVIQGSV